ncbi:hypothetical protein [Dokdonia sp. Hel_I_53]|uniref:hypothetical protein n=1 Tax=Dokdonia sp. Hel_I_53 TaxID=1566287 RepID=UPI00119B2277|nr:hypothetical protein [Dokdonia sp. Hel_I_53]TVZ50901.1 hypothetical protein OD90_0033 [Dokdonia sp. Hel_I_53]
MKTFLITLFSLFIIGSNSITETITATYSGYSEGTYYFEDEDGLIYSFESISESVSQEFDLVSESFEGKKFKVSYSSEMQINEDDEEYEVLSITALELLK